MQIIPFIHNTNWQFPDVEEADAEGLLQIGGSISADKILEAYLKGIFPWYSDGEPVLWWSPDPRFVLFPDELHISKSMQKLTRQRIFEFKINSSFEQVIHSCKTIKRRGQSGTWITDEMEKVYTDLYHKGFAHSAEAWKDNKLAGGMYGVLIGKVFFAESMFSSETNASKFALISFVRYLQQEGVALIDCQVFTTHLQSLGARLIPRSKFIQLLNKLVN